MAADIYQADFIECCFKAESVMRDKKSIKVDRSSTALHDKIQSVYSQFQTRRSNTEKEREKM